MECPIVAQPIQSAFTYVPAAPVLCTTPFCHSPCMCPMHTMPPRCVQVYHFIKNVDDNGLSAVSAMLANVSYAPVQ